MTSAISPSWGYRNPKSTLRPRVFTILTSVCSHTKSLSIFFQIPCHRSIHESIAHHIHRIFRRRSIDHTSIYRGVYGIKDGCDMSIKPLSNPTFHSIVAREMFSKNDIPGLKNTYKCPTTFAWVSGSLWMESRALEGVLVLQYQVKVFQEQFWQHIFVHYRSEPDLSTTRWCFSRVKSRSAQTEHEAPPVTAYRISPHYNVEKTDFFHLKLVSTFLQLMTNCLHVRSDVAAGLVQYPGGHVPVRNNQWERKDPRKRGCFQWQRRERRQVRACAVRQSGPRATILGACATTPDWK